MRFVGLCCINEHTRVRKEGGLKELTFFMKKMIFSERVRAISFARQVGMPDSYAV